MYPASGRARVLAEIFRIDTPATCALAMAHVRSGSAISRRHAARRTRASNRDSRRHARRHSSLPIDTRATNERIAPCVDGMFAKLNTS